VKKSEVERKLKRLGWYFLRHGGGHDIWTNGEDQIEVPRHPEINEKLARFGILRVAERSPGRRKS
jgi:mRNA interferase HicA